MFSNVSSVSVKYPLIMAGVAGLLVVAAQVLAQCTQDCNTQDSGLCQGSPSGSCPACIVGGSCGNSPGVEFFTGNPIHGSIMGNNVVIL